MIDTARVRIFAALTLLWLALPGCAGDGGSERGAGDPRSGEAPGADTVAPTEPRADPVISDSPGRVPSSTDGPAEAAPWRDRASGSGSADGVATLTEIRTATHENYDRLVLEFEGGVPHYDVEYPPGPLHQCGSGNPVTVRASATLHIRLEPAAAHDEAGNATIADRDRAPGLPLIRQLRVICDFEAIVELVLGVARRVPIRVFTLDAPARLVVDLERED